MTIKERCDYIICCNVKHQAHIIYMSRHKVHKLMNTFLGLALEI